MTLLSNIGYLFRNLNDSLVLPIAHSSRVCIFFLHTSIELFDALACSSQLMFMVRINFSTLGGPELLVSCVSLTVLSSPSVPLRFDLVLYY